LAQAIFEPNLSPHKYSNIFKPTHPSYLSAYEDRTDRVFRNDGIKNSEAGELPRSTQKSENDESLKSRIFYFTTHGDTRHLHARRIECTSVRDKTIIPYVILFKLLHNQMNT
jgi:hypothetical protein